MRAKEQLWYLINGVLSGTYDIKTFCSEFTRIYNLEVDYEELSKQETVNRPCRRNPHIVIDFPP